MRIFGLLMATVLIAGLIPTTGRAESEPGTRPDEPIEPYHKHHDTRHGHDHYYPDRGAIVRDLPRGTIGLNYAGLSYRYHDGVWFEPRGPAFMVVDPPIGLVVPSVPPFATVLAARGGETYLYVNGVYYRPRPDLGGYEVVNDPPESVSTLGSEMFVNQQSNNAPGASPPAAAIAVPVAAATAAMSAMSATPLPAAPVSSPAAVPLTATSPTAALPLSANPVTMPGGTPAVAPAAATAVPPVPSTNSTPPAPTGSSAAVSASAVPVPTPPNAQSNLTSTSAKGPKVFLYPRNGQSADQQARDRYDCYRFAVAQSGFDPLRSTQVNSEGQSDFERAQSACFDARGYASR